MSRRDWAVWGLVVTGMLACEGDRSAPLTVPQMEKSSITAQFPGGGGRVEVVEGEGLLIPVVFELVLPPEEVVADQDAAIGITAMYQDASPVDVQFLDRVAIPFEPGGPQTRNIGLRALMDGIAEGRETLRLRLSLLPKVDVDPPVLLLGGEMEVVIVDGPDPCAGVSILVSQPEVWGISYTAEVVVQVPVSTPVWSEILAPSPNYRRWEIWRHASIVDWSIEEAGGVLRTTLPFFWEPKEGQDGLRIKVCGGPNSGTFVRCTDSSCWVYDSEDQS